MANLQEIKERLNSLTLVEAACLVKMLEDTWGVSAALPVPAQAPNLVDTAPVEEQTEFDVTLIDVGPNRIKVISAIRNLANLGLRESKEAAENLPYVLLCDVSRDIALQAAQNFKDVGATVEIG